jgi:predicted transcriptional regulator
MTAFTIRLPDDVADRLNQIAQKLDRSRFYVAA